MDKQISKKKMRISIGCDHAGFDVVEKIIEFLSNNGYDVQHEGCYSLESVDYPEFGHKVGKEVASGKVDRGIVVCGSGIGISIAANKIKNIIEIGSNDGTFLKNFNPKDYNTLGFEPSGNVAKRASMDGTNTINEFFNKNSATNQKHFAKNTDLICAANVICHIPDLKDLIQSVDLMLNKNGLFVFEEPYLGSMFEKISYDQIYDEHIFIFSVTSVSKIFKLFDMELVDVLSQTTHGGSIRYIIARKNNHKISNNVNMLLEKEKLRNLDNISSCKEFKDRCELSKIKTRETLLKFKNNNYKIAGYAATSKSTTILNYCNINNKVIDYICDTTPEKIGKFSPGTHIPIVDMSHFKKFIPDVAYLFAWNHKDEIFKKEKNYKGKWFSHVAL